MKVEVMSGVGVELSELDLAHDDDLLASGEIQSLFAEHGLLLVRDQNLSEADHIRLAEKFGEINVNRFFTAHDDFPQIAMVTKEKDQVANIGGGWHTDHSYDHEPALGSILVARELPTAGGDTWFSSMYKAYDALSDGLKQTLEGLSAVHSAKHVFGSKQGYSADSDGVIQGRIGNSEAADVLDDPIHPVVIKHPLSGRKALYVNPAFTIRFDGWSAEESAPLLQYLYTHAGQDEFVTKFSWRPGSMAFWDNRATWHFAQNDYHGERRVMHRITVEGCALSAASANQ